MGGSRQRFDSSLTLPVRADTCCLRRECEGDDYVNIVRKTRFLDARTRRDVAHENTSTFFLYEVIAAFRRAAEAVGSHQDDAGVVFWGNAQRLLAR